MGDSFTIDGDRYLGTFAEEQKESLFSDFSNQEKVTRSCTALKSQFTEEPDPSLRPVLVFGALSYSIVGLTQDQLHYTFKMERLS